MELLQPGLLLRATLRSGRTCRLTIREVRPISDGFLVKSHEFIVREELQALAGAALEVDRDGLPRSDAQEPYLFELIGASAVDESGVELGRVRNVASTTGQDLLILEAPNGEERMLPLVDETFVAYDPGVATLTLRPIPGLWEITADQGFGE